MPRRPKKSAAGQSEAQQSRSDRIAQIQREAKAKDRRSLSVIWVALGGVLVLIGGLVVFAIVSQPERAEVQEYEWSLEEDIGHVDYRPDYEQQPPAYGEHNAAWWNCGTYEEPVPDHHAVHSLEHGAIWLTYQPELPEGELETLRALADQPDMLLSPYPGQESPVIATAWGRQLFLDEADDSAITDFIRDYMNDPGVPEPNGICYRGTTTDLLPPEVDDTADETGEQTEGRDPQDEAPGDVEVETDAPPTQ